MIINSMKRAIATALTAKLREITELKYVEFGTVRLSLDEFNDAELPAVQIWDAGTSIDHARTQIDKTWGIEIELIMKETSEGRVNQLDLWDMEATIERKIGERPNLGVPRLKHLRYVGNKTDLHFTGPHYTARLSFEALILDAYTAEC